eukprot:284214-Pleurochrysis_carterae.AAC.1
MSGPSLDTACLHAGHYLVSDPRLFLLPFYEFAGTAPTGPGERRCDESARDNDRLGQGDRVPLIAARSRIRCLHSRVPSAELPFLLHSLEDRPPLKPSAALLVLRHFWSRVAFSR